MNRVASSALAFWIGIALSTVSAYIGSQLGMPFSYAIVSLIVGSGSTVALITVNNEITRRQHERELGKRRQADLERKRQREREKKHPGSYAVP